MVIRLLNDHKWISSLLFGLAGFLLVLFTTATYGAGVSGDAVDYISTADSLVQSFRFIDFAGEPYIYWPPLFPMLLALLSWLTSLDTFVVGWLFNTFCFGLIVILTGLLFRRAFGDKSEWFYFGALVSLTSLPLMRLAANITTDPFFIVLVLTFTLLGGNYLANPKFSTLLWLAIVSGSAAILRWHGVILIFTLVILVLTFARNNLKTAFLNAIWVGLLSSSPLALWVLGRNYRLLGNFMGYRDTDDIDIFYNLSDSIEKISHWFLPDQLMRFISPIVLFGGFVIILIIINPIKDWRTFFRRLAVPQHLPWLVFSPVYYLFVIFTSIAYDHPTYFDDRYFAPLFGFVFLFMAFVILELLLKPLSARLSFSWKNFSISSVLLFSFFLIWLAYPSYRLYKYIVVSRIHGEPTYNIYNNDSFHQSELIQYLDELNLDGNEQLYSNYPAAVYFYTRQTTRRAPIAPSGENTDLERLVLDFSDWPGDPSYLIWFLPNDWHYYYEPEDLVEVADLKELFLSKDGIIYLAESR